MKIGFDHNKYLEEQSKYILERVDNFETYTLKEFYQDLMKMQRLRFLAI